MDILSAVDYSIYKLHMLHYVMFKHCTTTVWTHLPLAALERTALLPHFWEKPGGRKWTSRNCCIITHMGGFWVCVWTGFFKCNTCVCVRVLDCVSRPVWGCWQCCKGWSYWAARLGSPTLARTPGLGSFGPPCVDGWRQEDSLQWISGETTRQPSNEVYYQEAVSEGAPCSKRHRMFCDW